MASTFITPRVIASRGIATLYNVVLLAGLVWRDFDADFSGKQGDTITVRKPAVLVAEEFDRTARTTSWQDATEDSVDITLDKLAHVPFHVTDEQVTLQISDFQAQLLDPAMMALALKVDSDLAAELVAAANGSGGGGVAGKSGQGSDYPLNKSREKLTRAKMPVMDRFAVLSPEATTDALNSPRLVEVNKAGTTDALREAIIGRLFGQETYESQVFGVGAGAVGHADGVAFHRSAIVLAARPLQQPRGIPADQYNVASFKNLSLRVIYSYDHDAKMDKVTVDMLYGVKTTRAAGAVELDFGQGS